VRDGAVDIPGLERELSELDVVPREALAPLAGALHELLSKLEQASRLLRPAVEPGEDREPAVRGRAR